MKKFINLFSLLFFVGLTNSTQQLEAMNYKSALAGKLAIQKKVTDHMKKHLFDEQQIKSYVREQLNEKVKELVIKHIEKQLSDDTFVRETGAYISAQGNYLCLPFQDKVVYFFELYQNFKKETEEPFKVMAAEITEEMQIRKLSKDEYKEVFEKEFAKFDIE